MTKDTWCVVEKPKVIETVHQYKNTQGTFRAIRAAMFAMALCTKSPVSH